MTLFNPSKKPENQQPNVPFALAVHATNNSSPIEENRRDIDKFDEFWFRPEIEPLNWNKNFPYQITLVKVKEDGQAPDFLNNWSYTLPISPESLNISYPFASSIYATQGGVIEEHNGMPFRVISISGTTGVFPVRNNAGTAQSLSPTQSIFAGTIRNGARFTNISNNLGFTKVKNLVTDSEMSENNGTIGKGTGYYQFHVLSQFLERYAAFKKTAEGRDYRMAFMMWKDQHYYLVKPESFNLSRSAGSPFEYKYSMSFKAWKRIKFQGNEASSYTYNPPVRDQGAVGQILNGVTEARNAIAVCIDTIKAIGFDLENAVFEPMRQTINLCKDLLGVPKSVIDVPKQLIKAASGAVVLWTSTRQNYENFNKPGPDGVGAYQKEWETMADVAKEIANLGQESLAGEYNSNRIINNINRVLSGSDQIKLNLFLADAAQRLFEDPDRYTPLFDAIPIGSLQISSDWHRKVQDDSTKIRQNSNRAYWEAQVSKLEDTLTAFENAVGAGDDIVNSTYQNPDNSSTREPTDEDYDIIYNLNLAIQSMSQLAVSEDVNFLRTDPTTYIAGLARRSGIAFQRPAGKFLVPFPYGFDLETLAVRYLGDASRWLEIAALNGLVAPYIDEVGFSRSLVANGYNNQITIDNVDNLYVGHPVSLISNAVPKTARIILKIKKVNTNLFTVTLDGDSDLSDYTTNNDAYLHAFLPNTVNSQMSLFIPSNETPEYGDFIYKPIPSIDNLDQIFKIANIDLLLDQKNDLIVTNDGDSPLAVGLNAIIQDLRIKVSTPRSSLLLHPTYGLPVDVGYSLADVSALDILQALKDTFKGDPTYTNFSTAQVNINGPVSQINFTVGLRGLTEVLPITIDLN